VHVQDVNSQVMIKLWGQKAGQNDFAVGHLVKFWNVIVEHYDEKTSLSTIGETYTEVSFFSSFIAARDPAYS